MANQPGGKSAPGGVREEFYRPSSLQRLNEVASSHEILAAVHIYRERGSLRTRKANPEDPVNYVCGDHCPSIVQEPAETEAAERGHGSRARRPPRLRHAGARAAREDRHGSRAGVEPAAGSARLARMTGKHRVFI